ncbi:hypothetical protein [Arthrobacter koreensis]|nr:hypothetical protein [Arthrobacter koreensis]
MLETFGVYGHGAQEVAFSPVLDQLGLSYQRVPQEPLRILGRRCHGDLHC